MTFVPLAAMLVACPLGRGVRLFAGDLRAHVPARAHPVADRHRGRVELDPDDQPWIWYLVNVATVASVLAFPLPLQVVWTAFIPILFGVVRLIQGVRARLLVLGRSGRLVRTDPRRDARHPRVGLPLGRGERRRDPRPCRGVVRAGGRGRCRRAGAHRRRRSHARQRPGRAHRRGARRTRPRERTLAVAMAREALTRLANTEQDSEEGSDEPRDAASLADDIERSALELGVAVRVERTIAARTPVDAGTDRPGPGARRDAGDRERRPARRRLGARGQRRRQRRPARVRITVRDTGAGFDLDRVPHDRLGIRASIFARVAAVGGTSAIESDRDGTTVRLEWREGRHDQRAGDHRRARGRLHCLPRRARTVVDGSGAAAARRHRGARPLPGHDLAVHLLGAPPAPPRADAGRPRHR